MRSIIVLFICNILLSASELSAMEDACDRGMSNACYELSSIYSGEDGLNKDLQKALFYLRKSCELDHDKACLVLEKLESNSKK